MFSITQKFDFRIVRDDLQMKTIEKIESMNSIESINFHEKQKQYVF